jgi:CRISPR system Cascade subunit CasE
MIAAVLSLSFSDCKIHRITDPYSVHRVVYSLFPKIEGEERDFLFADKGGSRNQRRILILSKRPPLRPEYGCIETREIPASFLNWDRYGFEVRLNPTKRDKASGKIVPAQGTERQDGETKRKKLREWFCAKSERWGFLTDPETLHIQSNDVQRFDKQNNGQVTQNAATFIGKLQVTDRSRFIESFEEGMGRGKGFGFGLLELVPLKG